MTEDSAIPTTTPATTTATTTPVEFSCPKCDRHFRWKPTLAGRRLRCTCGAKILCPAANPSPAATPAPVLSYRATAQDKTERFDPEQLTNLHLPLWLLAGGVTINVVAAFLHERTIQDALMRVGVGMMLSTAVMLGGVLLAVRFRGIHLGRFWVAVMKLAAISVAPSAVVLLVQPLLHFIPLGGIVGWIVHFCLYFALLGVFFDLDESDTWYCVAVIFLLQLGLYFLILWKYG